MSDPSTADNKPVKKPIKDILFITLVAVLLSVLSWQLLKQDISTSTQTNGLTASEQLSTDTPAANGTTTPLKLNTFTGAEFVSLYNAFAYPNVREFDTSPSITGNLDADERIRELALERGYIGRSIALPPLQEIDGGQLQERVVPAWQSLKDAAQKAGYRLTMTAGFRTIEDQRDLFLDSLQSRGATAQSIANGTSDAAVNSVLKTIAIPGYTRHHSGYTVDIGCENNPGTVFAASSCFAWLSRNNYENAKIHGWIPSYPEGAPKQGPDPEAWEYSWVGTETLKETAQ